MLNVKKGTRLTNNNKKGGRGGQRLGRKKRSLRFYYFNRAAKTLNGNKCK